MLWLFGLIFLNCQILWWAYRNHVLSYGAAPRERLVAVAFFVGVPLVVLNLFLVGVRFVSLIFYELAELLLDEDAP